MASLDSSSNSFHIDETLIHCLTDEVNAALPADLQLCFSPNTESSGENGAKEIESLGSHAVSPEAGTRVAYIPSPRPHVPFSPNIICNENPNTESPPSNVWRPVAAERRLLPKHQNNLYQNALAKATNSMMQKVRSASMTSSTTGATGSLTERNSLIDNEEGKDVEIDEEQLNLGKRKITVESPSSKMVEPRIQFQKATFEQQIKHENDGSCAPANQCRLADDTNRRDSFGQCLGTKALSPIRCDDEVFLCGFRNCRPQFLKPFTSPIVFLPLLSLLAFCQGMIVNGFVNVNVSTLERRFQLSSSQLGLVCGAYDLFNIIFTIPFAFIGGRGNKPLFLSFAAISLAAGAFIFSLPHFVIGPYEYNSLGLLAPTCDLDINVDECAFQKKSQSNQSNLHYFVYLFILSQAFNSIGGGLIYSVGLSFLHESVTKAQSPIYVGIFYAIAGIGPAAGYILGGSFLDTFVDFDKPDAMKDLLSLGDNHFTPNDPRWCGAWWLGFTISMFLAMILVIPLAVFPRVLGGKEDLVKVADESFEPQDGDQTFIREAQNLSHYIASHALNRSKQPTSTLKAEKVSRNTSVVEGSPMGENNGVIINFTQAVDKKQEDYNNNNTDGNNTSVLSETGLNFLATHVDQENNKYFIVVDPPGQQYSQQAQGRNNLDLSSIAAVSIQTASERGKRSVRSLLTPPQTSAYHVSPSRSAVPISVVAPFVSSSIKLSLAMVTSPPKSCADDGDKDPSPPLWLLFDQLKQLFRNPILVFLSLSLTADLFLLNGFAAFMPKFLQHQFSLTASYAALLMGSTLVMAATLGVMLGGIFVKCYKLKVEGMLVLNIFMGFLCCFFLGVLWIRCDKNPLAGVTESPLELENSCNSRCDCPTQYFEPVCDPVDRMQYFSACHAGCKTETREYGVGGTFTIYKDCFCLGKDNSSKLMSTNKVVAGLCEPPSCPLMWVAIAGMFMFLLCHSFCTTPSTEIIFYSVPKESTSVALATYRNIGLLGSIASPYIFGVVIDSICVLWQESSCDKDYKGSCWIYDEKRFGFVLFVMGIAAKVLSVYLQSVALVYNIYNRVHKRDQPDISLQDVRTVPVTVL